MPISMHWENEQHTALLMQFQGKWSWDEYHVVLQQIAKELKLIDHRVTMIYDLQQSAPLNTGAIRQADLTFRLLSEEIDIIAVVAKDLLLKVILSTFKKAYKQWSERAILFETVAEVRAFLEERNIQQGL